MSRSVILQAFTWHSWKKPSYFKYMKSKRHMIKACDIDAVWFPPCSKSVSPQGYMPLDLYDLDSEYGNRAEVIECVQAFKEENIDVYADVVINHRCAHYQNSDGVYNVFGGSLPWDDTAIVSNDTNFQGKGEFSEFPLFEAAPNIDHSNKGSEMTFWIGCYG